MYLLYKDQHNTKFCQFFLSFLILPTPISFFWFFLEFLSEAGIGGMFGGLGFWYWFGVMVRILGVWNGNWLL